MLFTLFPRKIVFLQWALLPKLYFFYKNSNRISENMVLRVNNSSVLYSTKFCQHFNFPVVKIALQNLLMKI